MRIPEHFIDEVVAQTDLVDLVGEYVTLQQKGKDHWGLCPFHLEKKPSFHVVSDQRFYKCFGCGKGGGAINFAMEMENLSFIEGVEFLAKRAGMMMPEGYHGDGAAKALRDKIFAINQLTARYFYRNLHEPQGAHALKYLQERELSPQILTRFGLGFAPDSWDGLINEMKKEHISDHDLVEAGLAIISEKGRIYDRFRNRVMFPIINVSGNVIGFGGRVMDDSTPKYLNSPDTAVFDKSRNLFGLNYAKKTKSGLAIVTEGYMDTIALHQAGFDGAVASLGTSLTEGHAQLLGRYFKQSVLSYDGDSAGVSATQRAIPLLEKAGLAVRVLQMRGAKDPDEFIKKYGRDAFIHLLEQSDNHVDYRLEQIKKKYNLEDSGQKVECLQECSKFLATMESPIQREIYATKVAEWVEISKDAVMLEVDKEVEHKGRREKKQAQRVNLNPTKLAQPAQRGMQYEHLHAATAEEGLLRVLNREPAFMQQLEDFSSAVFSAPLLGKTFDLMKERHQQGLSVELPMMTAYFTSAEMDHLVSVMNRPQSIENLEQAMMDYLNIMEKELDKRSAVGDDQLLAAQKRNS